MENYTNAPPSTSSVMSSNRTGPLDSLDTGLLVLNMFKCVGLGILILGNWCANTMCVIVLRRLRELNPVTKILMFSMTAADMATGFMGVFVLGAVIMDDWPFGEVLCRITGILNSTLIAAAMFSLLTINAERYIAVTRPFHYQSIVTIERAYGILILLWSTALTSGILNHLLPWRRTVYHPILHSCVADPMDPNQSDLIGTAWNGIFFLLPILITMTMFLRIYRVAKHHANRIAAQTENAPVPVGGREKLNLKGSATFFLMAVAILSLSTPTLLGYLYENMTRRQLPVVYSYICTLFVFSYSIVNVGIYYARNTAFRRTAKIIFRNVFYGEDSSSSSSAAVVSAAWT